MDESIKMQLRESYSMQRIDEEFEEAGKRLAELEQAEKELGETQLLLIEEQERNQRLIQCLAEVEQERDEAHEDACFYKSCALSGEVPIEGSQPSAKNEKVPND